MKKIIYFIVFLIISSCSNRVEKANYESKAESSNVINQQFDNELQTKQKLQDYFDLLVLQKKHPEFKQNILKQLENISSIKKEITDTNAIKIDNLVLINTIEKIGDSIKKMKITFDVNTIKNVKKDTMLVEIHSKKIKIDDKSFISKKIKFYK